jgi:pimeloyl-ACP methyl ester carboxylesterase
VTSSLANHPITLVRRERAPITWVFFSGYAGVPEFVALLSTKPGFFHLSSMFGRLTEDNILTVGHPLPGHEEEYCDWLLSELSGPVVLVGLSRGGQVANQVFRRHEEHPGRLITKLGLVLISTPSTCRDLRPPFRQAVQAVLALHIPSSWGAAIKIAAPLFVARKDRKRLRQQGLEWVMPQMKRSVARSTWVVDSVRALAQSAGFGPPINTGRRVVTLNLPERRDEVVSVVAARSAASSSYPGASHIEYDGTHHGVPEVDGQAMGAAFVDWIRPFFMEMV